MPILIEASSPDPSPHEFQSPSGWWILPAIIVGFVEAVAIIGWFISGHA
jgi:hypothetical protein